MIKLFRKFIAFVRNTFVADCPVCLQHFYGFHPYSQNVKVGSKNYRIMCHRCVAKLTAPVKVEKES